MANRSIRASILPGMWTTSLDLSDAYFHIPISQTYRKYLRFVWNNKVFQFKALPFGLSTAPLAFTKNHAGSYSSPTFPVYSDSFLPGRFPSQGILPNQIEGSDRFGHQLFSVPRFPYLLEKVRDNSVSRLCFPGRTFPNQCRPSPPTRGEIYKTMSENTFIPDGSISHSTSILATSGSIELSGRCNSIGTTSHSSASVLSAQVMDCSFTRMGSIDSNHSAFISTPSMVSVILATDNTTVVAYLKNQGGTHSPSLYQIARDILLLCFQLQVHLVVRHIAGHLNILADTLSRSLAPVNTEWELLQVVFKAVTLHWGSPQIDLFATSLNHKLLTFVSPVPDPKSFAVDAMSLSWKGMFGYAFPPFRFLSPVLQKIAGENCKIIVIAPAWPKQSWFSRPSAPFMCLSSSSTSETRPSVSNQGQGSLSKSRKTSSTRLASLRVSLRKRGFSEGATKHLTKSVRDSTSIVYDAKWSIFSDWCSEREIDPFQVTVQQLADFLVFLFESKGLCPLYY
ncbi:Hypothetical predicted protein [Mytilus galloprovincialis]|uniref:Reverse transcriptase domain-containing protein n=1 Tax=Mytilus galloprovincialis TaxID=29158 RepID=A0A8B6FEY0_MYTGA|nr:Hypothetical predicted protein [Mytilus galloprovincialis]